jgi:hypothetical protein
MSIYNKKTPHRNLDFIVTILLFIFFVSGCQTLRKKFVRRPKKEEKRHEAVLVPQDYSDLKESPELLYRRYFAFWKYWQQELIDSLVPGGNRKRQLDCISRTIDSLTRLKGFLIQEKQAYIDKHILRLKNVSRRIQQGRLTEMGWNNLRRELEKQRRQLDRELVWSNVKSWLVK